jgi:ferredoxin--NADP+ reductase
MTDAMRQLGPVREAVVARNVRVTPTDRDEVRRIRLRVVGPAFRFSAGQTIGVVVTGPHAFGNRYHVRRYSIASGPDSGAADAVEFDLLVRRCFHVDESSGERYPGIASHFLCDAPVGRRIVITGPFDSPFQVPADDRSNLVMIGTGTGIAPFRGFIQEVYRRKLPWRGHVRLYYGARYGLDLLYENDERDDLANYCDRESFKAFRAVISKPLASEADELEAAVHLHAREVWDLMQEAGTYVYLAGLGRIAGVFDAIMSETAASATAWRETRAWMQTEGRWSELIYR